MGNRWSQLQLAPFPRTALDRSDFEFSVPFPLAMLHGTPVLDSVYGNFAIAFNREHNTVLGKAWLERLPVRVARARDSQTNGDQQTKQPNHLVIVEPTAAHRSASDLGVAAASLRLGHRCRHGGVNSDGLLQVGLSASIALRITQKPCDNTGHNHAIL